MTMRNMYRSNKKDMKRLKNKKVDVSTVFIFKAVIQQYGEKDKLATYL